MESVAGRSRTRGWREAILAMAVALSVYVLLDAAALLAWAEALPVGPVRSVAVGATMPVAGFSAAVGLDAPERIVRRVKGESEDGASEEGWEESGLGNRRLLAHAERPTDAVYVSGPGQSSAMSLEPPTRSRKMQASYLGDSMMHYFGQRMVARSKRSGVVNPYLFYKLSSGLSRPDFFNWPAKIKAVVSVKKPDAMVLIFGTNDAQNVSYKGRVIKYGTPAWFSLYRSRVSAAMSSADHSSRRVYWVGMPIMRDNARSAKMRALNRIYKEEAAKHVNVAYVDSYSLFSSPSGKYSAYVRDQNGRTRLMRTSDGIHLTTAGADYLAYRVLKRVYSDYRIKVGP